MRLLSMASPLALLVLCSCSSSNGSNGTAGGGGSALANRALARAFQRCQLASDGDIRAFNTGLVAAREPCRAGCLDGASCPEVEAWACSEQGALAACLLSCAETHAATFQCDSGDTVRLESRCDGEPDCEGNEDERDCATFIDTVATRCDGGERIVKDRFHRCDGVWDCRDGADERACPEPPFRCADGRDIVSAERVCDLNADCADASDEQGCARLSCPGYSEDIWVFTYTEVCAGSWLLSCDSPATCECPVFECLSGERVMQALVCDFIDDCKDASDEADCDSYGKAPFPCAGEEKALPEEFLCDGTSDCKDGSDEGDRACRAVGN